MCKPNYFTRTRYKTKDILKKNVYLKKFIFQKQHVWSGTWKDLTFDQTRVPYPIPDSIIIFVFNYSNSFLIIFTNL